MYAVAIAELAKSPGALPELAADLGTTLYELKLTLNAGLPAVVCMTVDASVAARAAAAIGRHGHRAVQCDRRGIAREGPTRYAGLGADLAPTSLENFKTLIARLRGLAPGAAYDERLLASRAVRGIADGSLATDLLAHLLVAGLG